MSKYEPLGVFLRAQRGARVVLSFEEIERLLHSKLPASKVQRAFWSNNPSNNVMTKFWLEAGFKTEDVDLAAGRLVFKREAGNEGSVDVENFWQRLKPLQGMVTIVPDTDLTAPAFDDSDWEETDAWGRNMAANKENDGSSS
jgi:hypothetical protein